MTNIPLAIGLFGYGSFGKFLAQHLRRHFPVLIYHPDSSKTEKLPPNCRQATIEQTASCQIVILAVNLPRLEKLLKQIKLFVKPSALVCDVTSVKVLPVRLMLKHLPGHVQILATHPLFGPQSVGSRAIELRNHKIVVHPVRVKDFTAIRAFLSKTLGLQVVEMTPKTHDQKMAVFHGLTFFLARGLMQLHLPAADLAAPSYQKLLSLAELERHHSPELFQTIESGNPYSAAVRQKLIRHLTRLDNQARKKLP